MAGGRSTSLQHLHDAQFYDAAHTRLLVDPRLTAVAAAVFGTPNVKLHHTKVLVRPPEQGSLFPCTRTIRSSRTHHPRRGDHFHFDDVPEEKGCFESFLAATATDRGNTTRRGASTSPTCRSTPRFRSRPRPET